MEKFHDGDPRGGIHLNPEKEHDEEKKDTVLSAVMGNWEIRYTLSPPDDDPQKEATERYPLKGLLRAIRTKLPKEFDDLKKMIEIVDSEVTLDELIGNYEKEREYQKKMEEIR